MSRLLAAIGFLTILPVPAAARGGRLAPARAFFPLVGLLLGGGLAMLDQLLARVLPLEVRSALLLGALIAATRGLHLDGFMDCCDALFGGYSRERRLQIMKDPHVGAFAVMGCAALLLAMWTALNALPAINAPLNDTGHRTAVLLLFPCVSRMGMLLAMAAFPYARAEGLGTAFSEGASTWQVVVGLAVAGSAAYVFGGSGGLVALMAVSAVSLLVGAWMSRLLGGLTGDCYGAINELAALAVLLLAASPALQRAVPMWPGGVIF